MKKHYQSGPFDSDIFGPMEAEVIDKRGLKWYYARCSCGWVGDRYATDSAANEAAWEHYFERQKIEDPRKHLRTPQREGCRAARPGFRGKMPRESDIPWDSIPAD